MTFLPALRALSVFDFDSISWESRPTSSSAISNTPTLTGAESYLQTRFRGCPLRGPNFVTVTFLRAPVIRPRAFKSPRWDRHNGGCETTSTG